jgi:hypothetical protein
MTLVTRLVPALLAGSLLLALEGQQKAWAAPLLSQPVAARYKSIYFAASPIFSPGAWTR